MILKSLQLTHFKNHETSRFDFEQQINCIVGKNGVGKTNLLDAIYYLSFTKSALGSSDKQTATHNERSFTIYGSYDVGTMALQYEKGKAKAIKIDGREPEKISDVIGHIPLVLVVPDDTVMIKEGSEDRRKFFDGALAQFNKPYLEALLKYNRLLKQRNALLKQLGGRPMNYQLVETYDDQLIPLAKSISSKRAELLEVFIPFFKENYQALHDVEEVPEMKFKSHVGDGFESAFRNGFEKDRIIQRTQMGSHKDDFEFLLDGEAIKKFGSQGQQKTFIIALKLALFDFLSEKKSCKPLLLLDDIFDKLDDSRIQFLVKLLSDRSRFGQVFITDARKDRSKALFEEEKNVSFIEIAR